MGEGRGIREGGRAKSYDREKAWPSINRSILSGVWIQLIPFKIFLNKTLFSLCKYLSRQESGTVAKKIALLKDRPDLANILYYRTHSHKANTLKKGLQKGLRRC
jgi:hypothetical protein